MIIVLDFVCPKKVLWNETGQGLSTQIVVNNLELQLLRGSIQTSGVLVCVNRLLCWRPN